MRRHSRTRRRAGLVAPSRWPAPASHRVASAPTPRRSPSHRTPRATRWTSRSRRNSRRRSASPPSRSPPSAPSVQTTGTVAFNGDRSTQVLAPVSGPITKILVNPGAYVRQGAPLATVTSPDFAAAMRRTGRRSRSTATRSASPTSTRSSSRTTRSPAAKLEQARPMPPPPPPIATPRSSRCAPSAWTTRASPPCARGARRRPRPP